MKALLFFCLISITTIGFTMKDSLPYISSYSLDIQKKMQTRIASLGKEYKPRTEHLNKDGSAVFVNDLIFEESPYLLQHAHNPVNWMAWSPQAFALAKKQNKPIFLSIGYATCHWCHVMEHESFENKEIAQFINQHFIAIKVDRERRTAIDAYYMTGVQMMTGHGGWPMSNFITPEGKPFFGGTYYNPSQFTTLLKRVDEVWKTQEADLRKQAIQMDAAITKHLSKSEKAREINDDIYAKANSQLLSMHDELQGGFSSAPKFPQEPWLLYLLEQNKTKTNPALVFTLDEMQQGGIYDQIGGGFHRYSVDNEWLVPHFEKMLYNQSQLGEVYTRAALQFNNPSYQRTAKAIFDYVLKEMVSDNGIFYSAGDADSQGQEGLFFTWTVDELNEALTINELDWLQSIYHFSKTGNFEHRNIFELKEPLQQTAIKQKTSYKELVKKLDAINAKLYQKRQKRIHPLIDNKAITSWNAQMIYSLAMASQSLEQPHYLVAAIKAMDFILKNHRNKKGHLVRNSLNGKASTINAELEDYAWMITAAIELYDVTEEDKWLTEAQLLIKQASKLFEDKSKGGFFDNIPEDGIPNTSRIKKSEDGATVSANGQMLIALARMIRRTGDLSVDEIYTNTMAAFSHKIMTQSISHSSMLRAKAIYDNSDNGNIIYAGNGKVKITSSREGSSIVVTFAIKQGWHINSNQAAIKSLVPLEISSTAQLNFTYPQAKTTQLDFSKEDLSTFEGVITVKTIVPIDFKFPHKLAIKLQACSDKICLAPDSLTITLF
jgi:uncharacterized protein YyaL (SSP411 family)